MEEYDLTDLIKRKHARNIRAWQFSFINSYLVWPMAFTAFCGFFWVAGLLSWWWMVLAFVLGFIAACYYIRSPLKRTLYDTARILDHKSMLPGNICSSLISLNKNYNQKSIFKNEFLTAGIKHYETIKQIKIPLLGKQFRYLMIPVAILMVQFLVFQAKLMNNYQYDPSLPNSPGNISVMAVNADMLKDVIEKKITLEELSRKTGYPLEELQAMLDEALKKQIRSNDSKANGAGSAEITPKKGEGTVLYSGKVKFSDKELIPLTSQKDLALDNMQNQVPPLYRKSVQNYLKALSESVQP